MRKIIVLLIFILIFSSCSQSEKPNEIENKEHAILLRGYSENYLCIINNQSFIVINYDNRKIDDIKLLTILEIETIIYIDIDKGLENEILNLLKDQIGTKDSLLEIYKDNKSELYNLINKYSNDDLLYLLDKIENQNIYYFEDLERINGSATYLNTWLNQVKQLEARKDL